MNIETTLKDKSIKLKEKVHVLAQALMDNRIAVDELVKVAGKSNDVEKGTCLEALELATRKSPELANQKSFSFAIRSLDCEAPRVKWEAAKIIGNTATLFKPKLKDTLSGLLSNSEHAGTVVRWSAAYALVKILACNTKHSDDIIRAIEAILKREENNAIRKIYTTALKKRQKNTSN